MHNWYVKPVHWIVGGVLLATCVAAEGDQARMLVDSGLVKKRPQGVSGTRVKPVHYRPVAKTASVQAADLADVGITFWRLRPVRPEDDPRTRLLTLDDASGEEIEQIAERIEAGTPLKPGERVRLSVEVPRSGFLYVFDREQFSEGRVGAATLIYPNFQTAPGDNAVAAGRLIEIPGRNDRINSFKLVRSGSAHVGEMLVVLVTPDPLFVPGADARKAPVVEESRLLEWQKKYGSVMEHLEMNGGAGKAMTVAEIKSGTDTKSVLTQNDPQPQSIYRVKAKPGEPILVALPLPLAVSADESRD